MKVLVLTVASFLSASSGMAQALAPASSPTATTILRAGTPIALKAAQEITTEGKHLRVGDRVRLEVADPIRVNGEIVIPAATPGVGEVTTVRNKGMWGKSGGVTGRVLYIRVGDRQIRMSGNFDDKGKTGTGGVVASAVLVPVVGFFVTGTSARIPLGAPIAGFLDEDVPVALTAITAVPLQAVDAPQAPSITRP